jgi:hypothetical protein
LGHVWTAPLFVSFVPDHDGPSHPCNLVGERDGRHFRRSALHQPAKPWPLLCSVVARIADDSHCPDDKQPFVHVNRDRPERLEAITAPSIVPGE